MAKKYRICLFETVIGADFQFVFTGAKEPDSPINFVKRPLWWDLNEKKSLEIVIFESSNEYIRGREGRDKKAL